MSRCKYALVHKTVSEEIHRDRNPVKPLLLMAEKGKMLKYKCIFILKLP